MAKVLEEAQLFHQFVVMEYCFPMKRNMHFKPRRADFLLFGKNSLQQNNVVVIETKQWEQVSMDVSKYEENVRIKTNGNFHEKEHPSIQAEGYAIEVVDQLIERKMENNFLVSSFAYLHNIRKVTDEQWRVLFHPKFNEVRNSTPLYTKKYKPAFKRDLRLALGNGEGTEVWAKFHTPSFH